MFHEFSKGKLTRTFTTVLVCHPYRHLVSAGINGPFYTDIRQSGLSVVIDDGQRATLIVHAFRLELSD